jgi:S1-C subfamily serine protease
MCQEARFAHAWIRRLISLSNSLVSLSDGLSSAVGQMAKSVVAISARRRFDSSGVHWSPEVVVTAQHTIRRDDEIKVTTAAGTSLTAELAGRDPGTDLAVLRVKGLDVPVVPKAIETNVLPGHIALAVGRSKDSSIAALGVIGSLSGPSQTWRGGRLERVIRLSIDLHPAGAGGAVTDAAGTLIGVATPALSQYSVFAIPPETIDRVSARLLNEGRVARGYLGAGLQPIAIPEHLRSKLGLSSSAGLIAMSVDPDAPAGRAGMLIGDVLIDLGGKAVQKPENVQEVLDADSVGKKMSSKVVRGGAVIALDITIGERPRRG